MKILLLEDDAVKRQTIIECVQECAPNPEIVEVGNWLDYVLQVNKAHFDIILLDLLVPRSSRDPKVEDHCANLIEATRGFDSKSARTPAVVLTRFTNGSEEYFKDFNEVDINVIPFLPDGKWREALKLKIEAAVPKQKYDFVILCALKKEADAFEHLTETFGKLQTISGLLCREFDIANFKGVIVQAPRTGLVTASVIATLAIERFEPRLICMSGICGGVPTASKIYDVLISEVCHQHDVGKWSNDGFKSEHHDIQIRADIRNNLEELIATPNFKEQLGENLNIGRMEYPEDMNEFTASISLSATSSGSAVIAEAGKTESLAAGQRKLAAFDMEVYAVYESARLSRVTPAFFAVKAVVDDGDKNKGDRFHRIGCLISAKVVVPAINAILTAQHFSN